ncbi:MAG: HicB like antitoxin of bacterial toxin-antitoxin system [Segetibacter sp.]|jgi:hypothetical protein|nr:HicB like antitoxin of bacterial toxin-antitoxin system [Segetibacter sp.]
MYYNPSANINAAFDDSSDKTLTMKLKIIIREVEEGEYSAEVPYCEDCFTQGETIDELILNIQEAVKGVVYRFSFKAYSSPLWDNYKISAGKSTY